MDQQSLLQLRHEDTSSHQEEHEKHIGLSTSWLSVHPIHCSEYRLHKPYLSAQWYLLLEFVTRSQINCNKDTVFTKYFNVLSESIMLHCSQAWQGHTENDCQQRIGVLGAITFKTWPCAKLVLGSSKQTELEDGLLEQIHQPYNLDLYDGQATRYQSSIATRLSATPNSSLLREGGKTISTLKYGHLKATELQRDLEEETCRTIASWAYWKPYVC